MQKGYSCFVVLVTAFVQQVIESGCYLLTVISEIRKIMNYEMQNNRYYFFENPKATFA